MTKDHPGELIDEACVLCGSKDLSHSLYIPKNKAMLDGTYCYVCRCELAPVIVRAIEHGYLDLKLTV